MTSSLAVSLLERAQALGVGVDALAGGLIQWRLAAAETAVCGVPTGVLVDAMEAGLSEARLAPTPELRRWENGLRRGAAAPNDLPELCIPARLLVRPVAQLERLLGGDDDDPRAIQAERLAALRGASVDALVPQLALRVATRR